MSTSLSQQVTQKNPYEHLPTYCYVFRGAKPKEKAVPVRQVTLETAAPALDRDVSLAASVKVYARDSIQFRGGWGRMPGS